MIKAILLVGLGSAGGGIMRYLVGKWTHSLIATSFPLGTMIVNVLGCFVIGLVYSIFSKNSTSAADMQLLLATGFCGGFSLVATLSDWAFLHKKYRSVCLYQRIFENN